MQTRRNTVQTRRNTVQSRGRAGGPGRWCATRASDTLLDVVDPRAMTGSVPPGPPLDESTSSGEDQPQVLAPLGPPPHDAVGGPVAAEPPLRPPPPLPAEEGSERTHPSTPQTPPSAVETAQPPASLAPAKTEPLALLSLALGIFSLTTGCCCGLFGAGLSTASIVAGILAIRRIDKAPRRLAGRGIATAGVVAGAVGLGLNVVSHFLRASNYLYDQVPWW